jgi:RNA polymerase sigma factor (sigma-70 family)
MTTMTLPVMQEEDVPEVTAAGVSAEVFSEFYRAEWFRLVRYLVIRGANPDDATEAAQHAFVTIFQRWGEVRHPEAWLRKVAFRRFLQLLEKNEQPLESLDAYGAASASDPIELEEEKLAVLAALRQLPVAQRQVMALHFDQFTISEISEILGMTEMAVRQNLTRARGRLKITLGSDRPRLRRAA